MAGDLFPIYLPNGFVECPQCEGRGATNFLDVCPLCRGFEYVPMATATTWLLEHDGKRRGTDGTDVTAEEAAEVVKNSVEGVDIRVEGNVVVVTAKATGCE